MLYLAFVRTRQGGDPAQVAERSRKWWNDGARPPGLRTIGIYGCIGTASPDVFVFDADGHDDIQAMVNYWRPSLELEVHPAVDLAEAFRRQGMDIA
jgi:hypothetical protein